MKKTIMLTFLMLICALISETLVESSARGSNLLKSRDSTAYVMDIKNKKEIADSIDSTKNTFAALKNVNTIEVIDEKILYRHVKGTVYHAVEAQCDKTPLLTADMSLIDTAHVNELRWVALSRDLLNRKFTDPWGRKHHWKGKIKLGDTIWVSYDNQNLWKITHEKFTRTNRKQDSIKLAKQDAKYEKLKQKYEQIKGYWIVHDVMGTQFTLQNRKGQYILDKDGNKQVIYIHNAIDFLQHPEYGMMDVWDRNIIISKRKVKRITSTPIIMAAN